MTELAMEAMAHRNRWYIDGLPINNMVIFHGELLNNQRVFIIISDTYSSSQHWLWLRFPQWKAISNAVSNPTKDVTNTVGQLEIPSNDAYYILLLDSAPDLSH